MRILTTQIGPDALGGLQTLAARFCAWQLKNGHFPYLFVRTAATWKHLLPKETILIEAGDDTSVARWPWAAPRLLAKYGISAVDAVFHLDFQTASMSECLFSKQTKKPDTVVGCFMPDYQLAGARFLTRLLRKANRHYFLFCLNGKQRLFMGDQQLLTVRRRLQANFDGTVLPLPVSIAPYMQQPASPTYGRIVTVCRLEPMKAYVIPLIRAVDSLRREGFDVTLDVYGEGILQRDIESVARKVAFPHAISMHGTIAYHELPRMLASAFAFVGMGTSAVEAAAAGVPVVLAIAHNDSEQILGLLTDVPFGNVGDAVGARENRQLTEVLRKLLTMSEAERRNLSDKMRNVAVLYDDKEVFPRWLKLAREAGPVKGSRGAAFTIGAVDLAMRARARLLAKRGLAPKKDH